MVTRHFCPFSSLGRSFHGIPVATRPVNTIPGTSPWPYFADILADTIAALRHTVVTAAGAGLPVPALAAALTYFDTMRQARGTANMIQGQRDYFGWHGFARLDTGQSDQHGPWAAD